MDFQSFAFVLKKTVTAFLVPPGIFLVLFVLGVFFVRNRIRLFLVSLFVILYLFSIEPTKDALILPLENAYPVPSWNDLKQVDAIVTLGGGANEHAPDIDGKGALSGDALQRLMSAYRLHLVLKKPIVIAGGTLREGWSEAEISLEVLRRLNARTQYIFTEKKSKDTRENAEFVAELCRSNKWQKIALVTSAFHMRRSVMLFGRHFKTVVPYPTDYKTLRGDYDYMSFLPDAENLATSAAAIKEYLGITYYKITLKQPKGSQ